MLILGKFGEFNSRRDYDDNIMGNEKALEKRFNSFFSSLQNRLRMVVARNLIIKNTTDFALKTHSYFLVFSLALSLIGFCVRRDINFISPIFQLADYKLFS